MKKEHERGYTMIEVIAVTCVIVMVMSGMAALVNSMFSKFKDNQLLNQVTDLRKLISERYAATGNYSDLSVKNLINEGIAPSDMVKGDKMINAYVGQIILGPANTYGSGLSYTMEFRNLPQNICIQAAGMNWRVDDTSTLVSLKINKNTYTWPINQIGNKPQPGLNTLPITMTQAQSACNSKDNNIITWEFQ